MLNTNKHIFLSISFKDYTCSGSQVYVSFFLIWKFKIYFIFKLIFIYKFQGELNKWEIYTNHQMVLASSKNLFYIKLEIVLYELLLMKSHHWCLNGFLYSGTWHLWIEWNIFLNFPVSWYMIQIFSVFFCLISMPIQ